MFVIYDKEYLSYFYIIKHKPSGKCYAGCRYAKDCNPAELLVQSGYCTSSKSVQQLVLTDGLFSFEIIEIRAFEHKYTAYFYESTFLQNIAFYDQGNYLNKSYNTNCRNPFRKLWNFGTLILQAEDYPDYLLDYKQFTKETNKETANATE